MACTTGSIRGMRVTFLLILMNTRLLTDTALLMDVFNILASAKQWDLFVNFVRIISVFLRMS